MTDIVDRLRQASHYALMDAARGLVREAADEIERLRDEEPHWIPVSERLPDEPGNYMVRDGIREWYYCDYNGEFLTHAGAAPITHWMPDSPENLGMRLQALPDRLAQEARRELDRLRWRDKRNRNIISRLKAELEKR